MSAFSGAFFAFLFLRLADMLTKIYERKKRHHSALFKIEFQLNQLLDDINGIIYQIDSIIEQYSASKTKNALSFFSNRIEYLVMVDRGLICDLLNLDMCNELISFNARIKRINGDIKRTLETYEKFTDLLFANDKNAAIYQHVYDETAKVLTDIIKPACLDLLNDSIRLHSMAHLRFRRDTPLFSRLTKLLYRYHNEPDFNIELEQDILKTEKSIEEIKAKSNKRIKNVLKRD